MKKVVIKNILLPKEEYRCGGLLKELIFLKIETGISLKELNEYIKDVLQAYNINYFACRFREEFGSLKITWGYETILLIEDEINE